MGAYDTDLPKLKVPGMENPPPATPQSTTDPMAGFKKQFADLASTAQQVGQTLNAPAPKPAPLLGPDAGSSILPALQGLDTYMRAKQDAAISNAKDVGNNILQLGAKPNSSYVDNGPTDPDTNGRKALPPVNPVDATKDIYNKMIGNPVQSAISSLPDYNPNGGIDVRAAAPTAAPDPFAYRGAPAPAAAPASTVPPVATPAKVETPAAGPTKENDYFILETPQKTPSAGTQELINRQNASRTPASDPYSGPLAAKSAAATGMPAPGGAVTPDLNGTPSQQTAYWAKQAAGLQERERYADQQNLQHQYLSMMLADQDFRQNAFQQAISNSNLGPATLAAIAAMTGHGSGAAAPASQAGHGMVSLTNESAKAAGDDTKNALTARGQDLTFAGHKLSTDNDMAKAKLGADVQREGHQTTERVHAADSAARAAQSAATNETHIKATDMTTRAQKEVAAMNANGFTESRNVPGIMVNKAAEVIDRRKGYGMVKKDNK